MKLTLRRIAKKATYTIGHLYVDGKKFCDTIEDTDRGFSQFTPLYDIRRKKVYAQTAIPTGTYDITTNVVSPSFGNKAFYKNLCGGKLPRLLNVPGFDGILIHVGNTANDSAGCILVGENTKVGAVLNSKATFTRLYGVMKAAADRGEKITITIE